MGRSCRKRWIVQMRILWRGMQYSFNHIRIATFELNAFGTTKIQLPD